MNESYNIKITHNNKEWLVFCVSVSFEQCREFSLRLARKYKKLQII
jgi:hypothetical protein